MNLRKLIFFEIGLTDLNGLDISYTGYEDCSKKI